MATMRSEASRRSRRALILALLLAAGPATGALSLKFRTGRCYASAARRNGSMLRGHRWTVRVLTIQNTPKDTTQHRAVTGPRTKINAASVRDAR